MFNNRSKCASSARHSKMQATETQYISFQVTAVIRVKTCYFATKINANLSQIFEKTINQSNFFIFFLLTRALCLPTEYFVVSLPSHY